MLPFLYTVGCAKKSFTCFSCNPFTKFNLVNCESSKWRMPIKNMHTTKSPNWWFRLHTFLQKWTIFSISSFFILFSVKFFPGFPYRKKTDVDFDLTLNLHYIVGKYYFLFISCTGFDMFLFSYFWCEYINKHYLNIEDLHCMHNELEILTKSAFLWHNIQNQSEVSVENLDIISMSNQWDM